MEPSRISEVIQTRAMRKAEQVVGQPLGEYLDDAYRSRTISQIAADITARGCRISDMTVARWMGEYGIELRMTGQRPPEAVGA